MKQNVNIRVWIRQASAHHHEYRSTQLGYDVTCNHPIPLIALTTIMVYWRPILTRIFTGSFSGLLPPHPADITVNGSSPRYHCEVESTKNWKWKGSPALLPSVLPRASECLSAWQQARVLSKCQSTDWEKLNLRQRETESNGVRQRGTWDSRPDILGTRSLHLKCFNNSCKSRNCQKVHIFIWYT